MGILRCQIRLCTNGLVERLSCWITEHTGILQVHLPVQVLLPTEWIRIGQYHKPEVLWLGGQLS
jgi:hypothetical protein